MFGNVTRTDVEAAERAVADGHRVDVERIALAREQAEPDPKPQTEPEARRELAGAEHELEIVQAQLTQVRAEYQRVAAEQHERWQTALEKRWAKCDQQMGRPLDSLAAAQADRIEVRSAWSWLTAPDRGDIPEHAIRKARASGQQLDLGDLTRTIEEGSCEAVTETAWRQHRERVEAQEAARLAREARREAAREALAAERERARLRHERMTSG